MGTVTVQSATQSIPSGSKIIGPLQIVGANQVGGVTELSFTGAQSLTVTPPVGATGAVIVAPSGNVVALTVKGVGGDTGIPSQPGGLIAVVTFANPSSPATFVVTSAGAVTGNVEVSFF